MSFIHFHEPVCGAMNFPAVCCTTGNRQPPVEVSERLKLGHFSQPQVAHLVMFCLKTSLDNCLRCTCRKNFGCLVTFCRYSSLIRMSDISPGSISFAGGRQRRTHSGKLSAVQSSSAHFSAVSVFEIRIQIFIGGTEARIRLNYNISERCYYPWFG